MDNKDQIHYDIAELLEKIAHLNIKLASVTQIHPVELDLLRSYLRELDRLAESMPVLQLQKPVFGPPKPPVHEPVLPLFYEEPAVVAEPEPSVGNTPTASAIEEKVDLIAQEETETDEHLSTNAVSEEDDLETAEDILLDNDTETSEKAADDDFDKVSENNIIWSLEPQAAAAEPESTPQVAEEPIADEETNVEAAQEPEKEPEPAPSYNSPWELEEPTHSNVDAEADEPEPLNFAEETEIAPEVEEEPVAVEEHSVLEELEPEEALQPTTSYQSPWELEEFNNSNTTIEADEPEPLNFAEEAEIAPEEEEEPVIEEPDNVEVAQETEVEPTPAYQSNWEALDEPISDNVETEAAETAHDIVEEAAPLPPAEPLVETFDIVEPEPDVPQETPTYQPPTPQEPTAPAPTTDEPVRRSLNDLFSRGESQDVGSRFQFQNRRNLREMIDLSERYIFTKELFAGDADYYDRAIRQLNQFETFADAEAYMNNELRNKYHWESKEQVEKQFTKIVERRFT